MDRLRRLARALRALARKERVEGDMDEEMRFHLAMETEELLRAGLDPREARRRALVGFGGVERFKEEARMATGGRVLEDVVKDARLALRALARSPGFTTVALVMLAVGIGANTAIFSVLQTVLLRPFPFHEPDRLVAVFETHMAQGWDQFSFSQMNLLDLMEHSTSFESVAAMTGASKNLTGTGSPELVQVNPVTPGFFTTLGVQPLVGRLFRTEDAQGDVATPVLLVGEDAWITRFGSDADVVGTSVVLDGEAFQVVGVLPGDGPWLGGEFYRPLRIGRDNERDNHYLDVIARLRPGVTREAAQAELDPLARQLSARNAPVDEGMGFRLEPASSWAASDELRQSLWLFMGAVGVLLLIACMNLANLLLARVAGRRRQVAMQVALGAGRGRVIRQLVTESVVLGVLGAILGVGVALIGLDLLVALEPGEIPRLDEASIDGRVLLFTAAIALATGLAGGLVPALRIPFDELGAALREAGRGTGASGPPKTRLRSVLVAAETGLSLVLLVGAGLLVRSLVEVATVDTGFDPRGRLTFTVNLPDSYRGSDSEDFRRRLLDGLRAQGAVEGAAAVHIGPLSGRNTVMSLVPAGETIESFGGAVSADWRAISDDYFRTLGLSLVRGQDLSHEPRVRAAASPEESREIVVSQSLARAVWPGQDPVGRRAQLWVTPSRLGTVVGVVEDMREAGPGRDETSALYFSYNETNWSPVSFVVHAAGEPRALLPAVRTLLDEIDPDLPMSNVETLDERVRTSTAARRFTMMLLAVFAGVSVVLALAGLYGVIAHSVSQRTQELGVRVALGAQSGDLLALVVRQGMTPAAVGIGAGLVVAPVAAGGIRSLLFGVTAADPLTLVVTGGVLTVAALMACWLPARAAVRLDPVSALREE